MPMRRRATREASTRFGAGSPRRSKTTSTPCSRGVTGIEGQLATQTVLADELGISQPAVSLQLQKAKEVLNRRAFDEIVDALEAMLAVLGGVARLDELARDVEAQWPSERCTVDALRDSTARRF